MFKSFINKAFILQALSQLCFGMVGALLILAITHKTSPVIATVNITGLEDSFIRETSSQSITDLEKKQKVEQFAKALSQTVVQIAKEKHLVLVPSQAVMSDAPDLTPEVARLVKKGLNP